MNTPARTILAYEIARIEQRFLTSTGCVDLLAMSQALPEHEFRAYVELHRVHRKPVGPQLVPSSKQS